MEKITFRKAILSDSKEIAFLNYKYCQEFLQGRKDKGFLKNSFTINEIEDLIKVSEIVVAEEIKTLAII